MYRLNLSQTVLPRVLLAAFVLFVGLAWGVLETVGHALQVTDMRHVPLLYISPCAQDSLALANTSMEFLDL